MTSPLLQKLLTATALLAASVALADETKPLARQSFDADWAFVLGDQPGAESPAFLDTAWRRLDVPHDWSAEADFSQQHASATGFLPGGIGWYRKSFSLPQELKGRVITVTFDGVYRDSDVWINGVHLGHSPSGYVGFTYDLTAHLRFDGQPNVLAVRVDRTNVADSRWYPGTGIYRHVWLDHSHPVHVVADGVFVTTPRITAEKASVATTTEVINTTGQSRTLRVTSRVLDAAGKELTQTFTEQPLAPGATFTFSNWQQVPSPKLWSPATPVLYTLETRLTEGSQELHVVRTPFGIRQFRFDPATGFFLNGENLLIKGVCVHHDGGVVGAAVPEVMWERRLRLLKNIGVNAIRCSHNAMAPELYALCDQLGFLVMDEAFDEWEIGKRKWVQGRNKGHADRYGYSAAFAEWSERDLTDQVRQRRNHPSIIMWSIGNEIDYPTDPYVHPESRVDRDFANFDPRDHPSVTRLSVVAPRLIAAVKRSDPTRPVTMALANVPAANGTGLADMLDVAGYNYQEKHYADDHALFPGRVIYGSENGKSAESWAVVRDRAYVSALFLWTGFDFLGEAGAWPMHGSTAGIFDTAGFIKPAGRQFAAFWSEQPVVQLVVAPTEKRAAAAHWNWAQARETLTVTAYANCAEVELFLEGRSLGIIKTDADRAARWQLPFAPGELRAVGRDAAGSEVARDSLRTAGAPVKLVAELTQIGPHKSQDVEQIVVTVIDAAGVLVPDAPIEITARVTGSGRVLGVDSGDLTDTTALRLPVRRTKEGRVLVIVKVEGKPTDPLTLELSASNLPPLIVNLHQP